MSRLAVLVAICSSVLLVSLGFTVASGAASHTTSAQAVKAARRPARFVTRCTFSHRLSDDPIVKLNMPGTSHSHDFFGNVTIDAASTVSSLSTGGTTCINHNDHSGYWVPSLTVDGVLVQPRFANVYYQSAGKPYKGVKTIPRGLEVVAGNAMATTPQSLSIVSWNCGADDNTAMSTTAPTCTSPTLSIHVNFPDCPTNGGPGVALASGGQYSGHADFFNAWVPKELDRLVKSCINAGKICKPQRRSPPA